MHSFLEQCFERYSIDTIKDREKRYFKNNFTLTVNSNIVYRYLPETRDSIVAIRFSVASPNRAPKATIGARQAK